MAAHALTRVLAEQDVTCLHVNLDHWIVPAGERDPDAGGEARARVAELSTVVADLRAGRIVTAPGYDAASRGRSAPVTYDPNGFAIIVLDGSFSAHRTLRAMVDLAVFVASPEALLRERFTAFYAWKGLSRHDIDGLWERRASDEWPAVDSQRDHADLVLTLTGNSP
jgi:uridine kinase